MDRRQKRRPMLHRVEKRLIMLWTEDMSNIAKGSSGKGCDMQKRGQTMIKKNVTII